MLTFPAAPAWAGDDEEEDGAPHIVLADDAGTLVIEEFDIAPAAVSDNTVTVFLSAFDSGTFGTRPLAGIFANDDIGFETEFSVAGPEVNVEIIEINAPEGISPFFISGGMIFSEEGEQITFPASLEVVDPDTMEVSVTQLDTHPFFGLSRSSTSLDPPLTSDFVGSAELLLRISDGSTSGPLSGELDVTLVLSTDPDDAITAVVPEPASAMLLVGAGFAVLAKRRRRGA